MLKPFVKWAGGKRQILNDILFRIKQCYKKDGNENDYRLIEPFVGGGCVFLALKNKKVIINDLNNELINTYRVIKNNPMFLMENLDLMFDCFKKEKENYYYKVRKMDHDDNFNELNEIEKAARFIFLNKTCYNGLYRVNSKGFFNTPIGKNKMKGFYDKRNILNISRYLQNNDVDIMCGTYQNALKKARLGDIVYVDPPYDYKSEGFTQYQKEGFTFQDFLELKKECDDAIDRGANVIISNNNTLKVIKQFENDKQHHYEIYRIYKISTKRSINCKGNGRNNGEEVIICGMPCDFPQIKNIESLFSLIRIKDKNNISNFEVLEKRFKNKYSQITLIKMMSALKFLKIIDNKNDFTDFGILLRNLSRKSKMEEFCVEIAKEIKQNPIFSEFYSLDSSENNFDLIYKTLKKQNPLFPESILRRRSEIIQEWNDWAKNVLN